eukprot:TRINITY_DN11869_c0_g1_i1.p1 TRINITY_DN11869_c0_g1~~TRINITY_DN11869_c0_g1_i1.p1  ORF type:complete len:912 (+),score=217.09 TRINITY_DN11869_c0_g1_i1:99-2834(+)
MPQKEIKVNIVDLGKAMWKGDVDTSDVKDLSKIVAQKSRNGLQNLKSMASMKSFSEALNANLSQKNLGSTQKLRSVKHKGKEKVFGSITGPDGSLALNSFLAGDKEDKHNLSDLPPDRRDRKRYNNTKVPTGGEVMDLLAEEAVLTNFEQPWYLASCLDQPSCQRVFYPAEFATRHRREDASGHEEHHHHGKDHHGHGEEGESFGLTDFAQAGFILEEADEVHWDDILVPNRLGLVQAIHRKTSIQRLCLIKSKHELPPGTSPKEVRNLVRQLQRCDHTNILYLHEAFEDSANLYFMYEYYPCVTLQSMLETHTWGQEDMVQIIRECCAATAHAVSCNLLHLSWTLCHVLIASSQIKKPLLCKVFGFGLMGVILNDSADHICWAPECIERYHQNGANSFLQKVESSLRPLCDSWSLGTIVYSLISRRPPALSEQQAQTKKWAFTLAIDDVDPEAKSLIEGLMNSASERRLTPQKALHHEWIRRRWRPPLGGQQVFCKLEDFCYTPLAKRLFGRFLTKFLDARHILQIAESFYALDLRGSGTLNLKELQIAARLAGRPQSAADTVFEWLAVHGSQEISLWRFAETLAEDVIDGRALRHAFESLDDDGSEQVSAKELYDELVELDESITMDDVIEHIEAAELGMDDDDEAVQDHVIDYAEFVQLFPVRVKRMGEIKDRFTNSRATAEELANQFDDLQPLLDKWQSSLEATILTIADLSNKAVDNRNENAVEAAKGLKRQFVKIDEGLKTPPGPADPPEMIAKFKSGRAKNSISVFGFNTYLQDFALVDSWNSLITVEMKALKQALTVNGKASSHHVDAWKAHDAADSVCLKTNGALARVKAQHEEYYSFADIFKSPEALMGPVHLSGRGLPLRAGEDDGDDNDDAEQGVPQSLGEALGGGVGSLCVYLTNMVM